LNGICVQALRNEADSLVRHWLRFLVWVQTCLFIVMFRPVLGPFEPPNLHVLGPVSQK